MKKASILSFLIVFFVSSVSFCEELPWKLALKRNNIKVQTRPVQGSNFDEFKGTSTINASLDVIVEVLRDIESYTKWMSDCSKSFVIEKIDDWDSVVYFYQELPWPVRDRDVCSQTETFDNLEKKEFLILFSSVERTDISSKKNPIRMASMEGHWKLTYIDKNSTLVEYQIKADPSGSIPAMIANMTSKKIPYETLLGLTGMVKQQKYIDLAEKSELKKRIDELISEGKLN